MYSRIKKLFYRLTLISFLFVLFHLNGKNVSSRIWVLLGSQFSSLVTLIQIRYVPIYFLYLANIVNLFTLLLNIFMISKDKKSRKEKSKLGLLPFSWNSASREFFFMSALVLIESRMWCKECLEKGDSLLWNSIIRFFVLCLKKVDIHKTQQREYNHL